jgi:hypothetical protein
MSAGAPSLQTAKLCHCFASFVYATFPPCFVLKNTLVRQVALIFPSYLQNNDCKRRDKRQDYFYYQTVTLSQLLMVKMFELSGFNRGLVLTFRICPVPLPPAAIFLLVTPFPARAVTSPWLPVGSILQVIALRPGGAARPDVDLLAEHCLEELSTMKNNLETRSRET